MVQGSIPCSSNLLLIGQFALIIFLLIVLLLRLLLQKVLTDGRQIRSVVVALASQGGLSEDAQWRRERLDPITSYRTQLLPGVV